MVTESDLGSSGSTKSFDSTIAALGFILLDMAVGLAGSEEDTVSVEPLNYVRIFVRIKRQYYQSTALTI